jgi:toxin ParE1/3/4
VRVRFTPNGRSQFLGALRYIRRDNPLAAQRFRERAEQVLKRLERFPNSGRHLPEFPQLPHREVIAWPYRFFYRHRHKSYGPLLFGNLRKSPKFPTRHRLANLPLTTDAAHAFTAPRFPGTSISSPSTAQPCCWHSKKRNSTSAAKATGWSFWVKRRFAASRMLTSWGSRRILQSIRNELPRRKQRGSSLTANC